MAKIKWGMMIVDGRGKLGGHVLSKNRAGAYVRTKVTPVNPQTTFQTAVRALFGVISQGWSGLSESVRNGWNEAVLDWQKTDIFGDLKVVSGKALYQRLNNQAQSAGYPAVNAAPAKLEMVQGIVTSSEFDTGSPSLTLVGLSNSPDARVVVSATPPLSAGTTFVKNQLRQIDSQVCSTFDENVLGQAYLDKFGAPAGGANVKIGVKYVLPNGQASPVQIVEVTVL